MPSLTYMLSCRRLLGIMTVCLRSVCQIPTTNTPLEATISHLKDYLPLRGYILRSPRILPMGLVPRRRIFILATYSKSPMPDHNLLITPPINNNTQSPTRELPYRIQVTKPQIELIPILNTLHYLLSLHRQPLVIGR